MTYIYENLEIWKKAMQFAMDVNEAIRSTSYADTQLQVLQITEASAVSVAGTIAAGKSFSSKHDFARHLYRARGALYETMTLLELLKRKNLITSDQFGTFDSNGNILTAMITALIKSIYTPKSDNEKSTQ